VEVARLGCSVVPHLSQKFDGFVPEPVVPSQQDEVKPNLVGLSGLFQAFAAGRSHSPTA
jgi:hypothetical protein